MSTIGKKIKQLRKEHSMTQLDLGKILNLGKSTISQYESGVSTPDSDTLVKIADFFKVSLDWLFGRSEIRNAGFLKASEDSAQYQNKSTEDNFSEAQIAANMERTYGEKPSPQLIALIKEVIQKELDDRAKKGGNDK